MHNPSAKVARKFELVGSVVEELARRENAKNAVSPILITYNRDDLALIVS